MGTMGERGTTWPASPSFFIHFYKAFQRFSDECDATVPVCAHNFLTSDSKLSCRAFIQWLYLFSVILVEECPSSTATVSDSHPSVKGPWQTYAGTGAGTPGGPWPARTESKARADNCLQRTERSRCRTRNSIPTSLVALQAPSERSVARCSKH